jgi:hypothetical protein
MSNHFEEGQKTNPPFSPVQDAITPNPTTSASPSAPGELTRSYTPPDISSYVRTLHTHGNTSTQPLALNEAIRQLPAQYWRVLTHPRATTFAEEEGKASWNSIWIQLIAIAIISAVFSTIGALESSSILGALGINNNAISSAFRESPLGIGLTSLLGTPISFFISTGLYFLLARAFGGRGTFLRYVYCTLLIVAPITLLNAVL